MSRKRPLYFSPLFSPVTHTAWSGLLGMCPKRDLLYLEDITINRPLRKYLKYASMSFLHTQV